MYTQPPSMLVTRVYLGWSSLFYVGHKFSPDKSAKFLLHIHTHRIKCSAHTKYIVRTCSVHFPMENNYIFIN